MIFLTNLKKNFNVKVYVFQLQLLDFLHSKYLFAFLQLIGWKKKLVIVKNKKKSSMIILTNE